MSSIFNPPKYEAPVQEPIEEIQTISEDADRTKKRIRKPTGRSDSLVAGISNALKSRLGQ